MKTIIQRRVRWFFLVWFVAALLEGLAASLPARAQFGGAQIVFDPSVYARQLAQLQQETAAVQNLASQLQYMIKNTTGGGAGVWQSNQNLLANLGWIDQRTRRAFVHLPRTLAAVPAAISGLPGDKHSGRSKPASDDHNHAQYSQWCARIRTGPGAEFYRRAGYASAARIQEPDRDRQFTSDSSEQ